MKRTILALAAAGEILAGCGTTGNDVAGHLRQLLHDKNIPYDSVRMCAHKSGNQYVCTVTRNGQQVTVNVTDDGHYIYEEGLGR